MNVIGDTQLIQSLKVIRDGVVIAKSDPDFSGSYTELRYKTILDNMLSIVEKNEEMPEALASEFDDISKHILRFATTVSLTTWQIFEQKYNLQKPD